MGFVEVGLISLEPVRVKKFVFGIQCFAEPFPEFALRVDV